VLFILTNKIQQDLDNINKWCSTWGFLLSPNKTVGIIFSRKRNLGQLVLKIGTQNHLHMIAYYHIYLGIPFFAVDHVSITYQMLFESL
jgi:hypothetical protein